MPPPSHISTFEQYATHLWSVCVQTFKAKLNPNQIYIVVDKPQHLPPPRDLVHTSCSNKTSSLNTVAPVGSTLPIPHSSEYSASLCIKEFKLDLINYITTRFIITAQETLTNMVIDSPSLECPTCVHDGNVSSIQRNMHGEADYTIWHHTIHCQGTNCLVVTSDTDVWVYGLGLWEAGWLRHKQVVVQRGITNEYVYINLGARLIEDYPQLQHVPYPISTMVALYVLTGCDYVSSFFKHTKQEFISCFFSNLQYILQNESLTFVKDGNGHKVFKGIVMDPWINLVKCIYLRIVQYIVAKQWRDLETLLEHHP